MTAPHRPETDYDRLHAELLPVLERHGVIAPGERLDAWIGVLRFRTIGDDGREYTRRAVVTAPGVTVDEANDMLAVGTRLLQIPADN